MSKSSPEQIGFLEVFDQHAQQLATAHLPSDIEHGVTAFRAMLGQFHGALMLGDLTRAEQVYDEAYRLAVKLNGGSSFGVIADDQAPGCVLARETAAAPGEIPLWGQVGDFMVSVRGVRVQIAFGGIFGIGLMLPSFSASAVDWTQPFISETGYRSFLGLRAPPDPGMTTAGWVTAILDAHIRSEMKGRLVPIQPRYRKHVGSELEGPA